MSVESSLYKEGLGSIKTTKAALAANTALQGQFDPPSYFDATGVKWVGFWYRTTHVTDITNFYIYFIEDWSNLVKYDFKALTPAINTWYFVRIPRASFTETGLCDWSDVSFVIVLQEHTSIQDVTFYVDELCLIE